MTINCNFKVKQGDHTQKNKTLWFIHFERKYQIYIYKLVLKNMRIRIHI